MKGLPKIKVTLINKVISGMGAKDKDIILNFS